MSDYDHCVDSEVHDGAGVSLTRSKPMVLTSVGTVRLATISAVVACVDTPARTNSHH